MPPKVETAQGPSPVKIAGKRFDAGSPAPVPAVKVVLAGRGEASSETPEMGDAVKGTDTDKLRSLTYALKLRSRGLL